MLSFLKKLAWRIGGLLVLVVLAISSFLACSPQLGSAPTAEQRREYQQTGHLEDDKFVNLRPTPVMAGSQWSVFRRMLFERGEEVAYVTWPRQRQQVLHGVRVHQANLAGRVAFDQADRTGI